MRKLLSRIQYWKNRRRLEQDLAEEIETHRALKEEELAKAGLSPSEAAAGSRRAMGNELLAREDSRGAWIAPWLDQLWQDMKYGLRQLRRNPGFTCVAVLTLAIGIGANAAIFTIVNGILLESLPYKDPQQLVLMFERLPNSPNRFGFSPPDFEFIRRESRSFSGMAAYRTGSYELSGIGQSQRVTIARVSPEVFSVLGATPATGRLLTEEDDHPNPSVVLITDGLWSRAFGRDPSVVGRPMTLDGRAYTIIGVMPRSFEFPPRTAEPNTEPAEAFLPIAFTPFERQRWGMGYNEPVVARLKPGVSIDQARSEIDSLVQPLRSHYPYTSTDPGFAIPISPFAEEVASGSRRMLLVLMSAVAMVLLIGCADVAGLVLTRSSSRQREMAIRSSLGGGPMRIFRQLLTEGLTLAAAGGLMALVLAWSSRRILISLAGELLPRVESIAFNFRVVAFTAVVALLTPLVFAAMPAIRAVFSADWGGLSHNTRAASHGRTRSRLLGSFVVAQVALALMLSVGAGLLVRSFLRLSNTASGFRPEQAVRLTAMLPSGRYQSGQQVRSFYDQAIQAAQRIPGVTHAAAGNDLPLAAAEVRAFSADGNAQPISMANRMIAPHWTSSAYFEALGIPLKRGRYFTEADNLRAQPVVIINESVARLVWPHADPIGQRIRWGFDVPQNTNPWITIVGVVGDVKQKTLDVPTMPQVYVPASQEIDLMFNSGLLRTVNLVVRANRDSGSLIADLRTAIRQLDPELPVKTQTLTDMIGDSVKPQRFSMGVVMLFAAIALLLAAIGIYGVLSNVVSQQTMEIGVRIALGATTSSVIWMVFRRALAFTAIGVGIGTAGAFALTRLMSVMLYETRPTDAIAFFGAALALALLAFAASLIPAWRATRIDPLAALTVDG
jgi:putative ABC transport system permease protein